MSSGSLQGYQVGVVGGGLLELGAAILLAYQGVAVEMVPILSPSGLTGPSYLSRGIIDPLIHDGPQVRDWLSRTLETMRLFREIPDLGPWIVERRGIAFSSEGFPWQGNRANWPVTFEVGCPSPMPGFPFATSYRTFTFRPNQLHRFLHQRAVRAGVIFTDFTDRPIRDLNEIVNDRAWDAVVVDGRAATIFWPVEDMNTSTISAGVVKLPPKGAFPWLDSASRIDCIDIRDAILTNTTVGVYALPRPGEEPGECELILGARGEIEEPGTRRRADGEIFQSVREKIKHGLPSVFTDILDALESEWRTGIRSRRPSPLIDVRTICGIPALRMSPGEAGMSISVGFVIEGCAMLVQHMTA